MTGAKSKRLVSIAKELNVGTASIVEHLKKNGFDIDNKPTTKLTEDMYHLLLKDFQQEIVIKQRAEEINIGKVRKEREEEIVETRKVKVDGPKIVGKVDLGKAKEEKKEEKVEEEKVVEKKEEKKVEAVEEEIVVEKPKIGLKVVGKLEDPTPKKVEPKKVEEKVVAKEEPKKEAPKKEEEVVEKTKLEKLTGPTIVGKIELPVKEPKKKSKDTSGDEKRRKRKRISRPIDTKSVANKDDGRKRGTGPRAGNAHKRGDQKEVVSEKEVQEKIKATMAKLSGGKSKGAKGAKYRKQKRDEHAKIREDEEELEDTNVIQVTEFISVSELANLMDVSATEVISKCFMLGVIVSINQRLESEIIELVADEFDFQVEFINVNEDEDEEEEEEDNPEDLVERAPIVTIMGHVDHGKTSLLDYIRSANVIAGEMGGITQHIGAYEVETKSGKQVTFLDTPGHEAFTAMRARGAKITDIAVIVIAADDSVMPQTKEAISHAQAAEVPMIFAFNKIDKEGANVDKVKEQLSQMNVMVESWGGKHQEQEISAKHGTNVETLLEKILLEAELLELKGNPNKNASGSVIEASLDKGRGYLATVMVQDGTLQVGDVIVAGSHYGKVKAMYNERGNKVKKAGPSTPVQVLGLNGAPQAGEKFKHYDSEQDAKALASRRSQIQREQGIRATKRLTLDKLGDRLKLDSFQELNLIVKGDVDGSVEALGDSLLKLSTEELQVNIIHKGVGQITESDILLASASNAIIIAFQVRPSANARALAEKESIDIRTYSIIYDAIDEVKAAMVGMLRPKYEEKIVANVEVRETFKISKVGTIAGCFVLDGKMNRNNKVRIIRDGIVAYDGTLDALKRYKDDAKEVTKGMECGVKIAKYNDIKVGDIIEAYEHIEIERTLEN
ncbi:MAG: translation initiation factor IF-2 [Chitinophagales bacterium]